jgi:hypothetical protein
MGMPPLFVPRYECSPHFLRPGNHRQMCRQALLLTQDDFIISYPNQTIIGYTVLLPNSEIPVLTLLHARAPSPCETSKLLSEIPVLSLLHAGAPNC